MIHDFIVSPFLVHDAPASLSRSLSLSLSYTHTSSLRVAATVDIGEGVEIVVGLLPDPPLLRRVAESPALDSFVH